MQRMEKRKKPVRVFTADLALPSGLQIELVRDPQDGLARLLAWDPREQNLMQPSHITIGKVPHCPVDEPEDWLRSVRLPLTATLGESVTHLVEQVAALFAPLGKDQALLLAAWAMSTWKAEVLPAPPQLFVTGSGAGTVLRALAAVCRRGVELQAQSVTGTFPSQLKPTLLLTVNSPRLARRLMVATSSSQPVWRGRSLVLQRTACAVAYADDAKPLAGVLNVLAEVDLEDPISRAEDLQSKLLGWRLQTKLESSAAGASDDPVLANLRITCSGDPNVLARVEAAYSGQVAPAQVAMESEEEQAVVAAVRSLALPPRSSLYVAEIAREAERRLLAAGSYVLMTPRHTGEVMRRLGIESERLGALGRGVRLTAMVLARLKELTVEQEQPKELTEVSA